MLQTGQLALLRWKWTADADSAGRQEYIRQTRSIQLEGQRVAELIAFVLSDAVHIVQKLHITWPLLNFST